MKQKAPLSNRRKTIRNLIWIVIAAVVVLGILQMTNSYTPAQAMRRYEHAQLIHRTEVMLRGDAPEETQYFSFWQLGKNDDVLTFTKFFWGSPGSYHCYGDIADIVPGRIACVALSYGVDESPMVYGCINDPMASSISLQNDAGERLAQFETRDMTLQDGTFYFACPLPIPAADASACASVEVTLRDGMAHSCPLAQSTYTSWEDAV